MSPSLAVLAISDLVREVVRDSGTREATNAVWVATKPIRGFQQRLFCWRSSVRGWRISTLSSRFSAGLGKMICVHARFFIRSRKCCPHRSGWGVVSRSLFRLFAQGGHLLQQSFSLRFGQKNYQHQWIAFELRVLPGLGEFLASPCAKTFCKATGCCCICREFGSSRRPPLLYPLGFWFFCRPDAPGEKNLIGAGPKQNFSGPK